MKLRRDAHPPDERGVALAVAVAVAFVVVLVSASALSQSVSSIGQSAIAGKQVSATDAAEAGLQAEIASTRNTQSTTIACPTGAAAVRGGTVATGSAGFGTQLGNYTVTYWYGPSPTQLSGPYSCASGGISKTVSTYYLFQSVGTTNASGIGRQTVQALVYVPAASGGGAVFDQAIFGNAQVNVKNGLTVTDGTSFTGNVYSNGPWACNAQASITGSVIINDPAGTQSSPAVDLQNQCVINGDLWSNGAINLDASGDQITGWTETAANLYVKNKTNNRSGPAYVGTFSGQTGNATCTGVFSTCSYAPWSGAPAAPGTEDFPIVNYSASAFSSWHNISDTACNVNSDLTTYGTSGVATVVNLAPSCPSQTIPDHANYTIDNDVTIFSPGGFTNQNGLTFTSGDKKTHNVYLIVPYSSGGASGPATNTCPTSTPPTFAFQTGLTFDPNVHVLFYSPCDISFGNNMTFSGQVYAGGNLYVGGSGLNLAYVPMTVPGATGGGSSGTVAGTPIVEYVKRTSGA